MYVKFKSVHNAKIKCKQETANNNQYNQDLDFNELLNLGNRAHNPCDTFTGSMNAFENVKIFQAIADFKLNQSNEQFESNLSYFANRKGTPRSIDTIQIEESYI